MKILDESTIINKDEQVKDENAMDQKQNNNFWRDVTIGGIPGILLGATGTLFAADKYNMQDMEGQASMQDEASDEELNEVEALKEEVAALKDEVSELKANLNTATYDQNIPNIGVTVNVAHNVDDGMSFSEAFASARAEVGPGGVFSWHGNVYGTYYESEWNAMSDGQKSEYAMAVRHTDYSSEVSDYSNSGENDYLNVSNEDNDVRILGEESVETEDGDIINVAAVEIDGHYGEIYDVDNDGYPDAAVFDANNDGRPDLAVVDENANGIIDEDEVYQVTDAGLISVNNPEDSIYDGMPDYTNDADTTSFI